MSQHQILEARQVMYDLKHYTPEEIIQLYGIEILADGKVYDITFNTTHTDVVAWVTSTYDDGTDFEKFSKHGEDFY